MSLQHYSRKILWGAAVALLIASAAGPAYLLKHSGSLEPAEERGADPARRAAGPGVVCFGYVDVEHGVAALAPLQPGRVARVCVQETEEVPAGAALLRLEDHQARLRVEEAEAGLASAKAQLVQTRLLPEQHRARLAQQRESIEAVRRRLLAAHHARTRKQLLLQAQQVSSEDVAAAQEQVKEMEALERAALQKLAEMEAVDPAADVRRAEADVAALQARLGQARQTLDECVLKAPSAGTVLRILAAPGDVLGSQPARPAVLFCPSGPRFVRAEVEQEFAGRLAVGQPALIEDDDGSGNSWRGRVGRISDWYTQRRAVLQEQTRLQDVRTIECLIALDDQPALRIGQRVRVWINREP
jgi:multidrug resistance efflux pump